MLIIKDQALRRIYKTTGFLSPVYSRIRTESQFFQRKSEKNCILAYYYAEKTQKNLSMTHDWKTSIEYEYLKAYMKICEYMYQCLFCKYN